MDRFLRSLRKRNGIYSWSYRRVPERTAAKDSIERGEMVRFAGDSIWRWKTWPQNGIDTPRQRGGPRIMRSLIEFSFSAQVFCRLGGFVPPFGLLTRDAGRLILDIPLSDNEKFLLPSVSSPASCGAPLTADSLRVMNTIREVGGNRVRPKTIV